MKIARTGLGNERECRGDETPLTDQQKAADVLRAATALHSVAPMYGEDDVYRRDDGYGAYYYARRPGGHWHKPVGKSWEPLNDFQSDRLECSERV